MSFSELVDAKPILDVGAADGGLSVFFESLRFSVECWDNSGTNINQMKGVHALAKYLNSTIDIRDSDLDQHF
jgi:2-polyprenyl-3-methyl-5-hydroxy-6-metoxy-1,4-benzoquinol methylase